MWKSAASSYDMILGDRALQKAEVDTLTRLGLAELGREVSYSRVRRLRSQLGVSPYAI